MGGTPNVSVIATTTWVTGDRWLDFLGAAVGLRTTCIQRRPTLKSKSAGSGLKKGFSHREQHTLRLMIQTQFGQTKAHLPFFCLVGGLSPWKPDADILHTQTLVRIWSLTGEDHLLPELLLLRGAFQYYS